MVKIVSEKVVKDLNLGRFVKSRYWWAWWLFNKGFWWSKSQLLKHIQKAFKWKHQIILFSFVECFQIFQNQIGGSIDFQDHARKEAESLNWNHIFLPLCSCLIFFFLTLTYLSIKCYILCHFSVFFTIVNIFNSQKLVVEQLHINHSHYEAWGYIKKKHMNV